MDNKDHIWVLREQVLKAFEERDSVLFFGLIHDFFTATKAKPNIKTHEGLLKAFATSDYKAVDDLTHMCADLSSRQGWELELNTGY